MRKIVSSLLIGLILLSCYPASVMAAEVKGRIVQKGSQRLVQLWGNHYEMGYAHGYLLGTDIMLMIEEYLISYLLDGSTSRWAQASNTASTKMQFRRFDDEINGIYQGMRDAGTNMRLDALGRDLNVTDLKVWSAIYDINLILPQCSSFASWSAASSIGTVHGRNFDFPYDPRGYAATKLTVFAASPTNGQPYMYVSWPGFVSMVSGMNDSRLALTVNVSNGATNSNYQRTDYMPMGLALREVMEDASGGDPISQVQAILTRYPVTRSANVQVSQPNTSRVIELDANGATSRTPSNQYIYATNHNISRPAFSSAGSGSTSRYNLETSTLQSLTTSGDRKVSKQEAISLLQQLTRNTLPTLHSILFYPENKSADVFMARVASGNPVQVTLAPYTTPQSYSWSDLFAGKTADGNADGKIDGLDYIIWLNNYGTTSEAGASKGDYNLDGKIDGLDYIVWLNNFGS